MVSIHGKRRAEAVAERLHLANTLRRTGFANRAGRTLDIAGSVRAFERGYNFARKIEPTSGPPSPNRYEQGAAISRLEEYFNSVDSGPGIWKWRHYFDIYDRHLSHLRGKSPHIVEIGVYSGGSLGMWADYFGPGSHIYGVDIEPACQAYESDQVSIFIGDQADPAFWERFAEEVPLVDVVIDDGGHEAYQQIATLEALLAHLQPGGVFICEDVLGPFQPFLSYVEGLTRPLSAASRGASAPIHRQLASVHHYPLVTVLEKPQYEVRSFSDTQRGTEWQPHIPSEQRGTDLLS